MYSHRDGYIKNSLGADLGSDKTTSVRLQLLWQPTAEISNLFTVSGTRTPRLAAGMYDLVPSAPNPANSGLSQRDSGALFVANCEALGFGTPPAGSVNCLGYQKPPGDVRLNVASANPGSFERKIYGVTNTLDWKLPVGTLTSVTNYTHLGKFYMEDCDTTPATFFSYRTDQRSYQASQELRLAGSTDRFRWIGGLYFLRINGNYDVTNGFDCFPGDAGNAFTQRVTSYAGFGQVEYGLAEKLRLIVGARWTKDTKTLHLASVCPFADLCNAFGYDPNDTTIDGSDSSTKASGKVQLTYSPTKDSLLYAGVSPGTKGTLLQVPHHQSQDLPSRSWS